MRLLAVIMMAVVLAACGSSPKKGPGGIGVGAGTYRVAKGDTLSKIARQHGQSVNSLMQLNSLRNPNHIRVGQVLRVNGSGRAAPMSAAGSSTVQAPTATTGKSVAAPRAIKLVWPAAGSHRRGTGVQSQGVFIKGAKGSPIKAAAAGKVMYAGHGLRGYGNMIIISHDDNFMSVYAHNDSLNVKENQSVKQGQTIATMGSSDTSHVQLYFELRYNGKAVDATRYLPAK